MDPQLENFIPNLICPISGQKLQVLDQKSLATLNTAIKAQKVSTFDGELVEYPLDEGLVTTDGRFVYPVLEGFIAGLLPNKAIKSEAEVQVQEKVAFSVEKKKVQDFYDEFGWKKTEDGYNDTLTFEDRRQVSEKYWSRCHLRLNKYLPGGKYLLDVASGSIPNDEYLTFSEKYQARICMDFSLLALQEAAVRLNGKGIFILGDMTSIPLEDASIDSVISMHTVYHIPQQEQTKAVQEAYRVIGLGGQAVIVYNWNKPLLMRMAFGLWRPVLKFYNMLRGRKKKNNQGEIQTGSRPELFLQQQNFNWYLQDIRKPYKARLGVYSAISRSFSNTFIKEKAFGKQVSRFLFLLENIFPKALGRWGQYPVFVLEKGR